MRHFARIQVEFLKLVADDMSGTVHKENEKRFELSELPDECKDLKPTLIKQGTLRQCNNGNNNIVAYARIRMKKEADDEPKYSLGVKHYPLHQEAETEVSKEMFDSFYPDNVDRPEEKLRYSLPGKWDVDVKDSGNKIVAECEANEVRVPKHWKIKKTFKYANLTSDMETSIDKPSKISVFLGGEVEDNTWRKDLKKMYKDLVFLDPYDDDWKPTNNIYDECAAMVKADKVIFYKGGDLTNKEKEFLKAIGKSFQEFNDLNSLRKYVSEL